MRPRAWLLAGGMVAALPLLSGCVAAAIPVLAAGGVLRTQSDGKEDGTADKGEPRVPIDISRPARTAGGPAEPPSSISYTLPNGTRMEAMSGDATRPPAADDLTPAAAATATGTGTGTEHADPLPDDTQALAAADALPASNALAADPAGFTSYDPFYGFADAQGTVPVVGSQRHSAVLAAPGTLAPGTSDCSIYPAAVLIDLDPRGGVLDPAAATHADPRLARTLAALRSEGIAVAWISANTADRAGAVRRALVASGLDPEGHDEIALLRYPEERKQTRREDLAKEFCLVAIAGDDRADFDELFQYLKDPTLAAPLEPLIGKGWFLIPQPLS